MMLDHPSPLPRAVEASASNRPVKIAYLVAHDESVESHMVLNGIFYEAYTRWGGAYTLIVPVSSQDFIDARYERWLQYYDPDFLYTYHDIDQAFIKRIDRLCSPIVFLKHEVSNNGDKPREWKAYIPDWRHYVRPVSSLTTISSPATFPAFLHPFERVRERFILTQNSLERPDRFLADNFGLSFQRDRVADAIPGFFSTLCLTQMDLLPFFHIGTECCTSLRDALAALTDSKADPIVRLAMAHSEALPRIQSANWAYAFRLFIGKTVLDRIHFWNCRQLTSNDSTPINSLIVDTEFFEDEELVKQLGQYLNRFNFLGHGLGQREVEIHSAIEKTEILTSLRNQLAAHTFNAVRVSNAVKDSPIPSDTELNDRIYNRLTDTTTLKLTEDANKITAKEPAHFVYIPPRYKGITQGQWIVELSIQRHYSLSKYSNVID